jgi:hypothetical protein
MAMAAGHSFVSLMSDGGVPIEKIAQLVGHAGGSTSPNRSTGTSYGRSFRTRQRSSTSCSVATYQRSRPGLAREASTPPLPLLEPAGTASEGEQRYDSAPAIFCQIRAMTARSSLSSGAMNRSAMAFLTVLLTARANFSPEVVSLMSEIRPSAWSELRTM